MDAPVGLSPAKPLDMREGALWAYRLLLNREPESAAAISTHADLAKTANALRSAFVDSTEFATLIDRAGTPVRPPSFPVDIVEGVRWAYRLLFFREPTDDEVREAAARSRTIQDVRRNFILSRDFELAATSRMRLLLSFEVLNAFAPFQVEAPDQGAFRDFIGSTTRVEYLPSYHAWQAGTVERHPNQSHLHGLGEWIGTLRSVLEADGSLVAVELGAGWGPWLIGAAHAARKRGIANIRLYGVEGSGDHYGYMVDHFRRNGFNPDEHHLYHAVVGAEDGVARFPRHVDNSDYGSNAVFEGDLDGARAMVEVRCIALNTLLADEERVDLIHVDIQGHEEVVLRAAIETLNRNTRRIVVGTHGRRIEEDLLELFSQAGWIIEHEQACTFRQLRDNRVVLGMDGEQVWRNPRI
jgi:FkbM family methyltransferase